MTWTNCFSNQLRMEELIKGTGSSAKVKLRVQMRAKAWTRAAHKHGADGGLERAQGTGWQHPSSSSHLIRTGWFQKRMNITSDCWGNLEEGYTHDGNRGPPSSRLSHLPGLDQNLRCNHAPKPRDWKKWGRTSPTLWISIGEFHSANDYSPLSWCGATVYHFIC